MSAFTMTPPQFLKNLFVWQYFPTGTILVSGLLSGSGAKKVPVVAQAVGYALAGVFLCRLGCLALQRRWVGFPALLCR